MLRSAARRALAAISTLVLAACSEGGAPARTMVQDATRSLNGSTNAIFAYSGRFTQSTTGSGAQSVNVTQQIGVERVIDRGHSVAVFSGAETLSHQSQPSLSFDAYVGDANSVIRIGQNIVLYKSYVRGNGISLTTLYFGGNGVFGELPQVQQSRWSNAASREQYVVDSTAGSSVDDVYAGDGSYNERSVPVEGLKAMAQMHSDGTAVYQWPYYGAQPNSTVTFESPHNHRLHVLFVNAAASVTEVISLGAWYPSTWPVLASDRFYDSGLVDVPASCGASKRFGQMAYEVNEVTSRLDIVFGELEMTKRTQYVSPTFGLVCLDVRDTLQAYYSYSSFVLSDRPISSTTISESLGLQREVAPRRIAAESVALPLDARLNLWRSQVRAQNALAIYHAIHFVRKNHQWH